MNIELLRQVDKYIGSIILPFSFIIGKTTKNLKNKKSNSNEIYIIKFLGLGSILQTYKLISILKENKYNINFITFENNKEILSLMKGIDNIYTINPQNIYSLIKTNLILFKRIIKSNVVGVIDLETFSYYSAIISTLIPSKRKSAFYSLYRKRLNYMNDKIKYNTHIHISNNYLYFAKEYISDIKQIDEFKNKIFSPQEIFIDKIFEKSINIEKPYLVISPFTSKNFKNLNEWDIKHWQKLILLFKNIKIFKKIIIVGAKNDITQSENIIEGVNFEEHIINLCGKLNIAEFGILIKDASLVISMDSFPFHFATLLKTPTIGLFGPDTPNHYGSNNYPNSYTIYVSKECSPCFNVYLGKISDIGCNSPSCLNEITPEIVYKKAIEILKFTQNSYKIPK